MPCMIFRLNNRKRYCEDDACLCIESLSIIYLLLQNLPSVQNDVTGRMAFAYTFMSVAHQIYLMTAMMNSIAHLKQTNAAAGMD